MNLKTKELERYSRQIIIQDIGISGQKKIKKSKVLIVGLGGLGCPVAEYLSRTGVGTIGLIDHDKVDVKVLDDGCLVQLTKCGDCANIPVIRDVCSQQK